MSFEGTNLWESVQCSIIFVLSTSHLCWSEICKMLRSIYLERIFTFTHDFNMTFISNHWINDEMKMWTYLVCSVFVDRWSGFYYVYWCFLRPALKLFKFFLVNNYCRLQKEDIKLNNWYLIYDIVMVGFAFSTSFIFLWRDMSYIKLLALNRISVSFINRNLLQGVS